MWLDLAVSSILISSTFATTDDDYECPLEIPWDQCIEDVGWLDCYQLRDQCNEARVRYYCRKTCATTIRDATSGTKWTTAITNGVSTDGFRPRTSKGIVTSTAKTKTTAVTTAPRITTRRSTTRSRTFPKPTKPRPRPSPEPSRPCHIAKATTVTTTKTSLFKDPCGEWEIFKKGEDIRCFDVRYGVFTFYQAERFCREEGSHLIWLDDEDFYNYIKKYFGPDIWTSFWLGMKKHWADYRWYWYDDDFAKKVNFSESHWASRKRKDPREVGLRCAIAKWTNYGKLEWEARTCNLTTVEGRGYICEKRPPGPCGGYEMWRNGEEVRCFSVNHGAYTFYQAQENCIAQGARVVWFDDENFRRAVEHRFSNSPMQSFWIGMKKHPNGNWYWYDSDFKKPVAWNQFHWRPPTEPDGCCGIDPDCVISGWRNKEQWDDVSCSYKKHSEIPAGYVCEWKPLLQKNPELNMDC